MFYIRVSSSGIHPFQRRVRIEKRAARDLSLHLNIAAKGAFRDSQDSVG